MTNINDSHKTIFEFIRDAPKDQIALVSCYRDGTPTAAICRVTESRFGTFNIQPLFVAVDNDMTLTDHDGTTPD